MVLVDTSVWVDVLRDLSGVQASTLRAAIGAHEVMLSRFCELELLQGARDEKEWELLKSYLDGQEYLELGPNAWHEAARIYFDLCRLGRTVRSPIDCCIAQLAIDYEVVLIHRDRDFKAIAEIRPLRQEWL